MNNPLPVLYRWIAEEPEVYTTMVYNDLVDTMIMVVRFDQVVPGQSTAVVVFLPDGTITVDGHNFELTEAQQEKLCRRTDGLTMGPSVVTTGTTVKA